jgi:hypothetical protein
MARFASRARPVVAQASGRSKRAIVRTTSELLFEEYLKLNRVDFDYEPEIPGSSQRPDFRLGPAERVAFVEVKEFAPSRTPPIASFGFFDPYPPIREKINSAARKFRYLKNFPCSLLLCNVGGQLIMLDAPDIVMGSMLGDLGLQFRINVTTGGAAEEPEPTFLGRGKMRDYKRNQPQNTTIGAILVLERFELGVKQFAVDEHQLEIEKGRPLTDVEFQDLLRGASRTVLRVKYHENPYARVRFPSDHFRGPFDEHWTWKEGVLERSFVGSELTAFEDARRRAGLKA